MKEVLPLLDNYCVADMPRQRDGESEKRRGFGVYPTEWIPYGSPYWEPFIAEMRFHPVKTRVPRRSRDDGEWVQLIRYENQRIVATRNHVNVTIRRKNDQYPDEVVTRIIRRDVDKVEGNRMPTECIPIDCPYYVEAANEMFFPTDTDCQWTHSYGRDGVKVEFCLGRNGSFVDVYRNGVKVRLFSQEE